MKVAEISDELLPLVTAAGMGTELQRRRLSGSACLSGSVFLASISAARLAWLSKEI
jgi:hypothetical protein